jgi:hypothetical protein
LALEKKQAVPEEEEATRRRRYTGIRHPPVLISIESSTSTLPSSQTTMMEKETCIQEADCHTRAEGSTIRLSSIKKTQANLYTPDDGLFFLIFYGRYSSSSSN